MVRVTGDLVKGLQTAFAENWLEASGEILPAEDFAPSAEVMPAGSGYALVVSSSPSEGRSTRARMLFQILVASARRSDRSLCRELVARRGVAVTLLMPGAWSVLGSTNFDNRSFGLNDEVNVAVLQHALARLLERQA